MSITSVLFKVTGKGEFPADMLRHDKCWPADTSSARMLTNRLTSRVDRPGHMGPDGVYVAGRVQTIEQLRTVYLRAESGWGHYAGPTVARWASFGWGCDVIEARVDGEDITQQVRRACGLMDEGAEEEDADYDRACRGRTPSEWP